MSDVQRYKRDSFGQKTTEPDGEWIQFVHYDTLARQLDAMTARSEAAESFSQGRAIEIRELEHQLAEVVAALEDLVDACTTLDATVYPHKHGLCPPTEIEIKNAEATLARAKEGT